MFPAVLHEEDACPMLHELQSAPFPYMEANLISLHAYTCVPSTGPLSLMIREAIS